MKYLLLFLLPLCLSAQDRMARLDSLLDAEVAARQFSGVVLLAENGQPFYQQARGDADAGAEVRLTPETPMRVASLTKAFTAVLVMQLIEAC
jgi:CubicO group peptidase (beta-lactamase class C family)